MVFKNRSLGALLPFVAVCAITLGMNMDRLEALVRLGLRPLVAQAACLPVVVMSACTLNVRLVYLRVALRETAL